MQDEPASDSKPPGVKERDSRIQVFARIRPTKRGSDHHEADEDAGSLRFRIPRSQASGYVNNQREEFEFRFNGVLGQSATQEDVFDRTAKDVVLSVLDGFNGTIFAYGQTGSGKTFTITGGPERYEDRGLIPRAISLMFDECQKRTGTEYVFRISYLEIYNNAGYDLLDPQHESKSLEALPKVTMLSDEEGNVTLKNLGMLPVRSEEDALNLLFVGDTNRIICETPSNDVSSRSHCIFTINVEGREVGSSVIRRSKLHLVDLAGSERIKKTNVNGRVLVEATNINLSLHYLEQVIVALHEKAQGARDHVPYRNSMMTSVLRDSLGGNCKTVMISTLSVLENHLDESIATCRFAQRVAMIRNEAHVNEEVDPQLLIQKLKAQVADLKAEIALLRGGGAQGADAVLSEEELRRCKDAVDALVRTPSGWQVACREMALLHPAKVAQCMLFLREGWSASGQGLADGPHGGGKSSDVAGGGESHADVEGMQNEIKKLKLMVQHRDNEIAILVGMMKGKTTTGDSATVATPARAAAKESAELAPGPVPQDRTEAFEVFRRSYRHSQVVEDQKEALKHKYHVAKQLGAEVNQCRNDINVIKARVEKRRLERGIEGIVDNVDTLAQPDPEEESLRRAMDEQKQLYRTKFAELKSIKAEIEHLQGLIEGSRRKMQRDFEQWWSEARQSPAALPAPDRQRPVSASRHRAAWQAPPQPEKPAQEGSSSAAVEGAQRDSSSTRAAPHFSTGNAKADADIAAFYRLREQMLRGEPPKHAR